ncbi:MAG: aryl-sulfate sulfotransferase [Cetobacterium sp.]
MVYNQELKNQAKQYKKIEEEYSELYYDFENPYIKINPYKNNPLVGIIKFETEKLSKIKLVLKAKDYFGSDYIQEFQKFEIDHTIEVKYLYENTNNFLELISEDENGKIKRKELLIKTEDLKSKYPIVRPNKTYNENKFLLLEYGAHGVGRIPMIIDTLGNIRGGLEVQNYLANILINQNENFVWAKRNKIYEYNILGKLIKVIEMGIYTAHHDIQQKPDGNYLVTVNKKGSILKQNNEKIKTVEDYIIEITPEGKIIKEWDLKKIMDTQRKVIANLKEDWIHVNSIFYDEEKNEIVVSANFQGIFGVDYNDNLTWIISDPSGYNERFKDKLLSKDESDSNFKFPYGQHEATKLENGNILAFDNNAIHFDWGGGLGSNLKKLVPENNEYSRAVEYRVDSENMKVYQEWEYVDKKLFSDVISGVKKYGDDYLITYGYLKDQNSNKYGKVRKVNKNKEIEYDFDIIYRSNNGASLYRSQILDLD